MGVWLFILLLLFEKVRQNRHFNTVAGVLWWSWLPGAESDRLVGGQSALAVHLEPATQLLKGRGSAVHVQNFEGVRAIKSASLLLFPPQIESRVINFDDSWVCSVTLHCFFNKVTTHQRLLGDTIINVTCLNRNNGLKNVGLNLKRYLRHILSSLIQHLLFLVGGGFHQTARPIF